MEQLRICAAQYAMVLVTFLVYDAKSMGEYGTVAEAMPAYFIMLWKLENILKLIENCEGFIEMSEKNTCVLLNCDFIFIYFWLFFAKTGTNKSDAYKKLIERIEQVCEWLAYAFLATLLSVVVFPLFYTGVSYCILHDGVESFYLYPPTKFV